jgi:hypothetical protein
VRCVGADHTAEQHGVRKVRPWLSLQAGGASGVVQGRLEDRGALSVFSPERGQRRATHPLLHQIEHVRSVPARPMPVALIGVASAGEADIPPAGAGHLAHGDRGQQGPITLEGRKCAHRQQQPCGAEFATGMVRIGSASVTANNVRETKIEFRGPRARGQLFTAVGDSAPVVIRNVRRCSCAGRSDCAAAAVRPAWRGLGSRPLGSRVTR